MILPGNALPKSRCAEGAASRRIDECHHGATRIAYLLYPPRNMRESAGCAPARSTIIGEPEAAPIPFRRSRKDDGRSSA